MVSCDCFWITKTASCQRRHSWMTFLSSVAQQTCWLCFDQRTKATRNEEAHRNWQTTWILTLTITYSIYTHIWKNLLFPQSFYSTGWRKKSQWKKRHELKHVCHQICHVELACTTVLWLCIICAWNKGTVDTCTWYTTEENQCICIYM